MNIIELMEGATPKLPGAPSGIKIMSVDQFVQHPEADDFDDNEELDEGAFSNGINKLKNYVLRILGKKTGIDKNQEAFQRMMHNIVTPVDSTQYDRLWQEYKSNKQYYVPTPSIEHDLNNKEKMYLWSNSIVQFIMNKFPSANPEALAKAAEALSQLGAKESIAQRHKDMGIDEATKLPIDQRDIAGQEFQDYMTRIAGTPDIDKKTGQVKLDKKGKEKYVSGKTKQDKYRMPYIHRSSVIKYYDATGKRYREEDVKQALAVRPKKLLKQNEKMKHSNGDLEQFFNIGFAALVGLALDENTNNLIVVNTCPGAGSCKIDCFAMKGGKIQFEAAWLSDGRIITYLLNNPDGFFEQLANEIAKEESLGKKGGYSVSIRWHDAGDFFSPEYLDLAFKLAQSLPDVKFYAYTKMANAALAQKPSNFIINWSEGAHTSQEKQVKAADPNLDKTKNSRIVPTGLFQDLLVKDAKGNLVKGTEGQWQVKPDQLPELKQRLAKEYGISANSILSYDEWAVKKSQNTSMKYNVIVAPGEPDLSANDTGVLSTLLLKH